MKRLFAFLPCYNEEQNIGRLIDEWLEQSKQLKQRGYELAIRPIDDCSKDGTKAVILQKQQEHPESVELIAHEVNKNLCGGLNTSIEYFLKNGKEGDIMGLMDGDATHSPKYVHSMLQKMSDGNLDCVIASRYCSDSKVVGVAAHREFMSDMAKLYYSMVLRVPGVKDYTCGYRIYTLPSVQRLVDRFGHDPIKEKSFACMMELLYKIYLAGGTFGEVGFELRYDFKLGASKMHVLKTMWKSLVTALKLRFI